MKNKTELVFNSEFVKVYKTKYGKNKEWFYCSRKKNNNLKNSPDAVVIIPLVKTDDGEKICVIKEYRVPIEGYEWGFPAGLIEEGEDIKDCIKRELKEETGLDLVDIIKISNPVYSSAGMTDESVIMAFVEAKGNLNKDHLEKEENIDSFLFNGKEVDKLLEDKECKIGAKAWGILLLFAIGKK